LPYLVLTPGIRGGDGVSLLSRQIALALDRVGSSEGVDIWSLNDGDDVRPLAAGRISVRAAGGAKTRYSSWAVRRAWGGCTDVDVLVTHAHLAPLSLPLGVRGARVFQWLHGIEVWKPLSYLQSRAFERAESLICGSAHAARWFVDANPGLPEPIVCHPGLPDIGLRPGDETRDEGFALTVGRMATDERYKGHDMLLELWADVLHAFPAAKLVVVGDGDDRPRLEAKARNLALGDAVRFAGRISDEELDGLYRRCSFFVMASRNEGFGLVFLEAMRASKACIGGAGAASEIIDDGATGFVVDPGERRDVVESMRQLFRGRELRTRMGERGRDRFRSHFTAERFRHRLHSVLVASTRTASADSGNDALDSVPGTDARPG